MRLLKESVQTVGGKLVERQSRYGTFWGAVIILTVDLQHLGP